MMTFLGFIVAFTLIWAMSSRIKRLEQKVDLLEGQLRKLVSTAAARLADSITPRPAHHNIANVEAAEEVAAVSDSLVNDSTKDDAAQISDVGRALAPDEPVEESEISVEPLQAAASNEVKAVRPATRIGSLSKASDSSATKSEPIPTSAEAGDAIDANKSSTGEAEASSDSREEALNIKEIPLKSKGISFSFEDLFGRRLPIWAGGITLAIAGVLIVKYAIDAGVFGRVFTPVVQIICGLLFGTGLIAGAEAARRFADRVQDPRVAQALSGAGIATLYAAVLMASNFYQLISPLSAFVALAAITAAALGLSIRFGAPTAVLGLAGGLAAPAMVGGLDTNVSLLAVYLGLTIAGMAGVSRMQRWPMLGLAALIGGAGWSLWMIIASSALDVVGSLSIGGFVILLAIGLPLLVMRGPRAAFMRSAAALVGAAQLAMLVALGGFEPLHWGLFALLAAAGQWLNWREKGFEIVPTISLGTSIMLLAFWGSPPVFWFGIIGGALAVIHAGPLLLAMWKEPARVQNAFELSGLAVAIPAVSMIHFYLLDSSRDMLFAAVTMAASLIPAAAIAMGWRAKSRSDDARFMVLTATGAALLFAAFCFAMPSWTWPLGLAAIAAALLLFGEKAGDQRLEPVSAVFAVTTVPILFVTMDLQNLEFTKLFLGIDGPIDLQSVLRWAVLSGLFLFFAIRPSDKALRFGAFIAAAVCAYGLLAQMLPAWMLPFGLAAVAGTLSIVSLRMQSKSREIVAAVFAAAIIPLLIITDMGLLHEWQQMLGSETATGGVRSALRWGAAAALGVLFAIRSQTNALRILGQIAAALMGYGAIAQLLPVSLLGLLAPLILTALAIGTRRLTWPQLAPAASVFMLLIIGWAITPIVAWLDNALPALAGRPMELLGGPLTAMAVSKQLLLPATLIIFQLGYLRGRLSDPVRNGAAIIAAVLAAISMHSLYRIGFAQALGTDFVQWGLLQRLIWEALLIGAGWAMFRFCKGKFGNDLVLSRTAIALAAAGTLHAVWFTLIVHNPLWAAQSVGNMPAFNLLAPTFAMPFAGILVLRAMVPSQKALTERPLEGIKMILIGMFAWASLRQFFHGPLLISSGVADSEDILRSILAIGLAIGFLLWGIRSQQRDWRIASLILIVLAVGKVFFFDASGLEGLMRIGSFVALGFSLIGIGWLYSRQLGRDAIAENAANENAEYQVE